MATSNKNKSRIVDAAGKSPAPEIKGPATNEEAEQDVEDLGSDTPTADDNPELREDEPTGDAAVKRRFLRDTSLPKRDRLRAYNEFRMKRAQREAKQQRAQASKAEGFLANRAEGQQLYMVREFVLLTPEEADKFNAKGKGSDSSGLKAKSFVVEVPADMEEQIANALQQVQPEG